VEADASTHLAAGPAVRRLARGASQQPDGQVNGSEMVFNDVIEKIGMIIDAAGSWSS
jgi:hypothetical protein